MNAKTRKCYPSITKIKEHTGLSPRFINDSIQRLKSYGLMTIKNRKGTSNEY